MSWLGKVVEFLHQGSLICGLVLEEKKDKLKILTVNKKEIKTPASKILHSMTANFNLSLAKEDLVLKLQEISMFREDLRKSIDLPLLWELLKEEDKEGGYTFSELKDIYFGGEEISPNEEAALLREVFQNIIYFKRQKDLFIPQEEEVVQKIKASKEEEKKREEERKVIASWLKALWEGSLDAPEKKEQLKQELPPESLREKTISQLQEVVLGQASGKVQKNIYKILELAGIPKDEGPFELLILLDIYQENENLELHIYNVPRFFNSAEISESQRIIQSFPQTLEEEKKKRPYDPQLYVFTIDEEKTEDRDDGLSLEVLENDSYRVGIHISDAAHFIEPHTLLDNTALERGTSLYLPDEIIPMLPDELTKKVFSLDGQTEKLSLSLFLDVDSSGEILGYKIEERVIKIYESMSYDHAEKLIEEEDPRLLPLYQIASKLCKKRMENGAQDIFFPFLNIRVGEKGKVEIEKVVSLNRSHFLVSEFMIWANYYFGLHAHRHGIPGLYRSQSRPENFSPLEENSYLGLYGVRRFLKRSELTPHPASHFTLGLEAYLQATSPIRRYSDLVNQRQLKSTLSNYYSYSEEDIHQTI
ncbi:MAG: RNB domain-containing ribonuclease, partial [Planctomycetota bacterium]